MTGPALRYPGSKFRLAPWIISHFPAHHHYVELFGGSAAVLLAKPRVISETINDLDEEIVRFYRVLRERPRELQRALALTPWSRREYEASRERAPEELEQVRRFVVRSWQGFGSMRGDKNGWRCSRVNPSSGIGTAWRSLPARLGRLAERLQGVQIEGLDAGKLLPLIAGETVLIYADPPYPLALRSPKTRGKERYYEHEMTDGQHQELLAGLRRHPGPVVLSGYECDWYSAALPGWEIVRQKETNLRSQPRIECLWLNRASTRQGRLW